MSLRFLDPENATTLWTKIFELIKLLTGDVKVSTDGTLQAQIDNLKDNQGIIENVVYVDPDSSEEAELVPIDADTLQGHDADYFEVKATLIETTLLSSGWGGDGAPYVMTVENENVHNNTNIRILPPADLYKLDKSIRNAMCKADIGGGKQGDGWFEVVAYKKKPEIDLPVILMIGGN